jgi:hypothetical protein
MELSAATKKCLTSPESVSKILNTDKNQDLKISAQEIKTAKKVCELEGQNLFHGYQILTSENPRSKNPTLDYSKIKNLSSEQIRAIQENLINPEPKEVLPAKTEAPGTPEPTRVEEKPIEKPTPKTETQKMPVLAPERKFKDWWEWKFLLPGYSAHMNDPTATVDKYIFGISQGLLAAKFLDVSTAKLETTTKVQFDYVLWATDSSSGDLKQITPLIITTIF